MNNSNDTFNKYVTRRNHSMVRVYHHNNKPSCKVTLAEDNLW